MPIFRRILVVFLLFSLVAAVKSSAAESTVRLDRDALAAIYEKFINDNPPFPGAEIKITNFSSRPDCLVLPGGQVEYLPVMRQGSAGIGRRLVELEVIVDGKKTADVKMVADLRIYGKVVTAVRALKRDAILRRADLRLVERDITTLGPDLAIDLEDVQGKQLKKSIRTGAAIFKSYLKAPQIIKRGDLVNIVAGKNGLRISVPGQARAAGALGEFIKVKNMMSRRVVFGLIRSEKEVEVTF